MKKLLEKKKKEENNAKLNQKMIDIKTKDSKKELIEINSKLKTSDLRLKNLADSSNIKTKLSSKHSKNKSNSNMSNNSLKSVSAFNSSDSDSFDSLKEKRISKIIKKEEKKKCLFFCF